MTMREYSIKYHKSITLTDHYGEELKADYLGKGRYSTAYRSGDSVYLITDPKDYSKEIASSFKVMAHLPECNFLGFVGERRLYRMPYYERLTKREYPRAWRQFISIRDLVNRLNPDYIMQGYPNGYGLIIAVSESPDIHPEMALAVEEMARIACNYGASWPLEVAKRNVGVDALGNLVLMDCLFDVEKIRRESMRRR